MFYSVISPFIHNQTTSATQTVGPVYLNTLSGTAQLGVVNTTSSNPYGTVTLSPGSYFGGSYGIGPIGYAPPMPATGVVEVVITNSKGATQTVFAMVDNGRICVTLTEEFCRIDGSDMAVVGDGDTGDGTEQESEEQAPHLWSTHY